MLRSVFGKFIRHEVLRSVIDVLRCVMLCYVVFCCVMLSYVALCCVMLCYVVLWCVMLC